MLLLLVEKHEILIYLDLQTQRWGSVAPLSVFHATSEADEYRGKTIPAKTTVIYNTSYIHHNDEFYRDSDAFFPERFLPEKDPRHQSGYVHSSMHYGFGIGRRECPGKHVADSSLYIEISRLLWAFNISQVPNELPTNETGEPQNLQLPRVSLAMC
jgi:cytochrome P450